MLRWAVSGGTASATSRIVFDAMRVSFAYGEQFEQATSILGASVESYETSMESPTSTGTVPLMSGITCGFLYTISVSTCVTLTLRKSAQPVYMIAVPVEVGATVHTAFE